MNARQMAAMAEATRLTRQGRPAAAFSPAEAHRVSTARTGPRPRP